MLFTRIPGELLKEEVKWGKLRFPPFFFLTKLFSTQTFGKQDMHRYNNQTSLGFLKMILSSVT